MSKTDYRCDFCGRAFGSIAGLKSHSAAKHHAEMDDVCEDANLEMFGEQPSFGYDHGSIGNK